MISLVSGFSVLICKPRLNKWWWWWFWLDNKQVVWMMIDSRALAVERSTTEVTSHSVRIRWDQMWMDLTFDRMMKEHWALSRPGPGPGLLNAFPVDLAQSEHFWPCWSVIIREYNLLSTIFVQTWTTDSDDRCRWWQQSWNLWNHF